MSDVSFAEKFAQFVDISSQPLDFSEVAFRDAIDKQMDFAAVLRKGDRRFRAYKYFIAVAFLKEETTVDAVVVRQGKERHTRFPQDIIDQEGGRIRFGYLP